MLLKPEVPSRYSEKTLQKNLAALHKRDPKLVERICLPVDGSHVQYDQQGRPHLLHHRTAFALEVDQATSARLAAMARESEGKALVVGPGSLALAADILDANRLAAVRTPARRSRKNKPRRDSTGKITAWDRDPWLVRLALMSRDFTRHLASGRLTIKLGVDLLDCLEDQATPQVLQHPLAEKFNSNELELLEHGLREKRALVCAGTLFVDDIAAELHERAYSVFTLDHLRLSMEEIAHTVRAFAPKVVFAVNYSHGLAEAFEKLGMKLICWEIDPSTSTLKPFEGSSSDTFIFTYRRANESRYARAGYPNCQFLPIGTSTERRTPASLPAEEVEKYACDVSFVGESMHGQALVLRDEFVRLFVGVGGSAEQAGALYQHVMTVQRSDFSTYLVPALLDEQPDAVQSVLAAIRGQNLDPAMLLAESAAAEKRLTYVGVLGRFGIRAWGDPGWEQLAERGVQYAGAAGHTQELNKIYSNSLINIDISRIYQMDMVTMRVFDAMACGGFVLAEYSEDLAALFDIGSEVDAYRTLDELIEKVRHYLANPDEARAIGTRGRARVHRDHTIAHRLDTMLSAAGLA